MSKKVTIKHPKSRSSNADAWVNTREGNKRLTIDLPVSLHTKLKIFSAKTSKTMGEIIKELLEKKLNN